MFFFSNSGTNTGPNELTTMNNNYQKLQEEYQRILQENVDLKKEIISIKFSHSHLKNPELRSLTGLASREVFEWVYALISPDLCHTGILNGEDQLLLVLMKLRMNLTSTYLATKFSIWEPQVSKIFGKCLYVMAIKLKFLIVWPSREEVRKNLPKIFKKKIPKNESDC